MLIVLVFYGKIVFIWIGYVFMSIVCVVFYFDGGWVKVGCV